MLPKPAFRRVPSTCAVLLCGVAAGCSLTHPGSPRIAAEDASWGTNDAGRPVWQERGARVVAFHSASPEFAFGGRISNRGAAPLRVTFRPVALDLPPGRAIGEAGFDTGADPAPFRVGDVFEVPPRDPERRPDPFELRFGLHRTTGADGPAPFSPEDVVTETTTGHGSVVTHVPGHARIGDLADYEIEIRTSEGAAVCRYRMRMVEGPDVVDFAWWQWPIAVVLLPVALPVWLLGGHH